MATAIDTLKTFNNLVNSGYTKEQAEGFVTALEKSELVTTSTLHTEIADLKSTLIMWMAGFHLSLIHI